MTQRKLPAALDRLMCQEPLLWLNERRAPLQQAKSNLPLGLGDVTDADRRLTRFATLLAALFPELASSGGVIESPLHEAAALPEAVMKGSPRGRWFIKADHELPVAGSIKARGGIYEVLVYAEELAIRNHLIGPDDDRLLLASAAARALFAQYEIAVGSTGNLGLSIGVIAAALGFHATVHMSADAKAWKKAHLRARGVKVIEHEGDYGSAVAAGRAQASVEPRTYFIDDENSQQLFLGYSVAAVRLQRQLLACGVVVDESHPLFVYLPCGVGGAPGGITFGLRHLLGDNVHCFFAEPVAAPCMLIRLASLRDQPIAVTDVGLDNHTEADGLAVGQASEFVAPMMKHLVSGVFTVSDSELLENLYLLERSEGLRVEPSAAASLRGPCWLLESEAGAEYLARHRLRQCVNQGTHIVWTTGGALLPTEEYLRFLERGETLWNARSSNREGIVQ